MVLELQEEMSPLVVSLVKCILWCCLLSSQNHADGAPKHNFTADGQKTEKLH